MEARGRLCDILKEFFTEIISSTSQSVNVCYVEHRIVWHTPRDIEDDVNSTFLYFFYLLSLVLCESIMPNRSTVFKVSLPCNILICTQLLYQKGKTKTSLDFLQQETMAGHGISWAICKSAPRPRQITMPAPHHSVLNAFSSVKFIHYCVLTFNMYSLN